MNEMQFPPEARPEQVPVPAAVPAALTPPLAPKKVWEVDGRDRILLFPALALAVLCSCLFFGLEFGFFGFGVVIFVGLCYGVLIWYAGVERVWRKGRRLLFLAVCLLALTFGLFSNLTFRLWNCFFLLGLITVQLFEGVGARPWHQPCMLTERFQLLGSGLFGRFGALGKTATSFRVNPSKGFVPVALGLGLTVPLLFLVVPMLVSADPLFRHLIGGALDVLSAQFSAGIVRVLWGFLLLPLLFGLLYALRRPVPRPEKTGNPPLRLEIALPITVLAVMDGLYVFFVGVQFAALFGGERYLAAAGVSFAEYARSGFFQLVWVAVINLTLVLGILQLCDRSRKGFRWVQILTSLLVGVSGVLLVSACFRMTLYVSAYGLSFKRFLTYWGMVMLCIFFATAVFQIWREGFSFFRVFFAAGVAGWLLLNYMNVDYLVARYNVDMYLSGHLQSVDVMYLAHSSYEALPALARLPADFMLQPGYFPYDIDDTRDSGEWTGPLFPFSRVLENRRTQAAAECAHWESWSLSAQLAALERGG